MRKSLWIILTALFVAACAPCARADTVSTFDISGTESSSCEVVGPGTPIPGCIPIPTPFSGVLTVDATTGTVLLVDIISAVPVNGLAFCNSLPPGYFNIEPYPSGVQLTSLCQDGTTELFLDFSTLTPGSLVGFDGGTIFGGSLVDSSSVPYSFFDSGTITPVLTPEPSTVGLMLLGVGLVIAMRKRIAPGLSQAS